MGKKHIKWLEGLLQDINSAQNPEQTMQGLIDEIIEFRERMIHADWHFEGQFASPRSIVTWPSQKNVELRHADLILSFMHRNYPAVRAQVIGHLETEIEKTARPWQGKSHLSGTLAKEAARRGTKKLPRKKTIWHQQSEYIGEKYAGYYALLRNDSSHKHIVCELFCLQPHHPVAKTWDGEALGKCTLKSMHRNIVNFLWDCEGEQWVGDLVIGKDKFAGVALRQATHQLPEPVTINLLRLGNSPHQRISFNRRPVLSGYMVGWNTNNTSSLFRTMFGLEKLKSSKQLRFSEDEFKNVLHSKGWRDLAARFEGDSWPGKEDLTALFSDQDAEVKSVSCQYVMEREWVHEDVSEWLA